MDIYTIAHEGHLDTCFAAISYKTFIWEMNMWSSIVYSEALKPDLESFINF